MRHHEMERYLKEIDIDSRSSQLLQYQLELPVRASSLFKRVEVKLMYADGQLHIIIPLAFRVPRDAGYRAFRTVEWINFELAPCQSYEYCACSETFRFHAVAAFPDSADALASLLSQCEDIVSEDAPAILDAVAAAMDHSYQCRTC